MKKSKEPTFEERIDRLQAIVRALEEGGSSLTESVALYKEGLEHAAACRKQLEQARHDIKVCTESGMLPFDDESTESSESQNPEEDESSLPF